MGVQQLRLNLEEKIIVYLNNTKFVNLTNVSFEAKQENESLCWELKGNGTLQIRIERKDNGKWTRETVAVFPEGSWVSWLATEMVGWSYQVKY